VTRGLAIGEGVETCLAAAHSMTPVWCLLDAGNLAAFPVLPGIESLTIFADADDAGMKAAVACAQRWAAHAEVVTITPRQAGADIADLVST
jgi:hypothetical protein